MRPWFDTERDWLVDLSDDEKRRIVERDVCEDCEDTGVVREGDGSYVDCHCPARRTT